ncbi:hypothetical protein KJ966_10110 [bacterium]|nr:hypothetical protein [bacterium]
MSSDLGQSGQDKEPRPIIGRGANLARHEKYFLERTHLDVDEEFAAGVVPLKINKELENASLVADSGSIYVKVKYRSG